MTLLDTYPKGEYHIFRDKRTKTEPIKAGLIPGVQYEPRGLYYWTCALDGLSNIADIYREKIQLIYIDPPFMTGQLFSYRQKVGDKGIIEHLAYSDQWKEGRKDFLTFMRQIFEYAYDLLTPDGSFYVHVDYRTSAYLRVILDEIFGEDNFLNEIIWHYKSGGRAKKHFSRKHDTILFYRKSSKHYFNIEAVGMERGSGKRNNMKREIDEEGRVFWSIRSGGKVYRYYEDSKIYPSDVWMDIPHLHQRNPERTGYDTQKPETLLERIILSSSRDGDYVADFFAGSGTTLAVADRLNRKWIGMDSSPHSMHVCRKRLLSLADRKDFVIFYGGNSKFLSKSEASMDCKHVSGSTYTIKLLNYIPSEKMKKPVKGKKSRSLEGLEYIDYWAVGSIKNDLFYPEIRIIRDDPDKPIADTINLSVSKEDTIVVHLVDVLGNQSFYNIHY